MNTRIMRGVIAGAAVLCLSFGVYLGACAKPTSSVTPRPADPTGDTTRPAGGGARYVIKFDRPRTAGLRYKATSTGRVDSSTTLNGQPLAAQAVEMTYAYEAEVTVKAVHSGGKPTRLEAKIIKLQSTQRGAARELLPRGTLVLAETAGTKEKFTVNGKLVSKDAAKVLGFVISLYGGDSTNTDDVFGPGGPRNPGDSWKPNAAKLLASLKSKFKNAAIWPQPSDVTGKVTFVAARKVNGMDVLEITAQTKINNIAPAMGSVRATAGSIEIGMSGWLPRDPQVNTSDSHTMTLKMHVEGEITKGPKTFVIVVDYDQSEKKSIAPIQ